MGLDAQVIAIGSFSEDVINALEYGAERYAGVEPGQIVITNVFVATRPSSISHELARAFGVEAMELGMPVDCALVTVKMLGPTASSLRELVQAEVGAGHPYAEAALRALG